MMKRRIKPPSAPINHVEKPATIYRHFVAAHQVGIVENGVSRLIIDAGIRRYLSIFDRMAGSLPRHAMNQESSRMSVRRPVRAAAAAIWGLTRWVRPPLP